ncbi:hypothetical protein B0T18DRAFT_318354 [Schizothecium vesticola]|uniref:STE24 endopeptidase n=1 Tax=Schizothecium vesticola TaxID=314040 RepID=A0AA40F716_9PEZI|nr:hypothetical protein B0T18DRAFT_318354 [Schizothecium vesticola]
MPTPLDNVMKSKNAFLAYAGLVTGVAVWAIWGGDLIPQRGAPTGHPETWSEEELRTWLRERKIRFYVSEPREKLLERVLTSVRSEEQK